MAWYSAAANRGYVAQGREKLVPLDETGTEEEMRKSVPDLKESLEIGRDDEPEMPNMWPSGDEAATEFKKDMLGFFETCKTLHMQVMRAIALGMGIEESWFDGFTDAGDNTLRLLHYPGVAKSVFKRTDGQLQVRAGEHSDYGTSPSHLTAQRRITVSRLHHPPLPRQTRRPASALAQGHLRQRDPHRRYHRRQRR